MPTPTTVSARCGRSGLPSQSVGGPLADQRYFVSLEPSPGEAVILCSPGNRTLMSCRKAQSFLSADGDPPTDSETTWNSVRTAAHRRAIWESQPQQSVLILLILEGPPRARKRDDLYGDRTPSTTSSKAPGPASCQCQASAFESGPHHRHHSSSLDRARREAARHLCQPRLLSRLQRHSGGDDWPAPR